MERVVGCTRTYCRMRQGLVFILVLFLASCIQHSDKEVDVSISDLPAHPLSVNYAAGFDLEYTASYTKVSTQSIAGNDEFADSIFILHSEKANLDEACKLIDSKDMILACQSSTHLAFINFFDKIETVKGLCGLKYVSNSDVQGKLKSAQTEEICVGDAVQTEQLLALNPSVYLTYPFENEGNTSLNDKGVQTLMIAEYLETHPIARLEWIKLFGALFGEEEKAESYFTEVENEYFDLVQEEMDPTKDFIFNLPWGDSWHMPSTNSLIVSLLQDAGMSYYFQDQLGTENSTYSKEEVWEMGAIANYWVIIANRPKDFGMSDLLAEEEVYGTFRSVQQGQVIFCNSAHSEYFIDGVIEPHIMLKDILFATGKIDTHKPKYFHLLK